MNILKYKRGRQGASACTKWALILGLGTLWMSPYFGLAEEESNVVMIRPKVPSRGPNTSAITSAAWRALEEKRYDRVIFLVDECVRKFLTPAIKQSGQLDHFPKGKVAFRYGLMNDVATCLFIKGRAFEEQGNFGVAKQIYQEIMEQFRFAQCWDPHGWFWSVASAAQDQIDAHELDLDYGDYTSATLTSRAWDAFNAGEYRKVDLYVSKCLQLYQKEAARMQTSLTGFPPTGHEWDYWALNDVATCLYIRGRALQKRGKNKEAGKDYQRILNEFNYGLAWDPRGWFWRIMLGAKRQMAFCPQG